MKILDTIKSPKLIKLLLAMGIHNYDIVGELVEPGTVRVCKWTGKKQIFNYEPIGGMSDIRFWEDIT